MHKRFSTPVLALSAVLLLLAGCTSIENYNPFGDSKPTEARKPENSTEYQCEGGKHFFIRMLDKGNAVWLIYPEREVNLDKVAGGAGTRYSNGVAVLDINGAEATLNDGPRVVYTGCKVPARK
jgi:membrane-bound inhibitor of C-type lysozyme